MKLVPPGDDCVPVPPPVTQQPDPQRFCDLVLTGGVASGVVYPWAIIELARHFRFHSIAGTSVGAIAACLAAAAEYGRRTGFADSFEAIRRVPASLAEPVSRPGDPPGRTVTRMESLFQPGPHGQRLFGLVRDLIAAHYAPGPGSGRAWRGARAVACTLWRHYRRRVLPSLAAAATLVLIALVLVLPGPVSGLGAWFPWSLPGLLATGALLLLSAGVLLVQALWQDIRKGIIGHHYGLCSGRTPPGTAAQPGLPSFVEWLHEGVQFSAGRLRLDRPLTFEDLWNAPGAPGQAGTAAAGGGGPQQRPGIVLQMMTTNVTHRRPYRLPLPDAVTRLFYRRAEFEHFFPPQILDALVAASVPYRPLAPGDPGLPPELEDLLELPGARMPIVVAARLSMSFPLLFSAVPLYALDIEQDARDGQPSAATPRTAFRRCWFSDGGVAMNFPIQLFDEALPRWPTFGIFLGERRPEKEASERPEDAVELPAHPRAGAHDGWALPEEHAAARPGHAGTLAALLATMIDTARSWHHRVAMMQPHVRTRVARLRLRSDEGDLNIVMPREKILGMAHEYGTEAGRRLARQFVGTDGAPAGAWGQHRWVRLQLLVEGLRELLQGLRSSAAGAPLSRPMAQALREALVRNPLEEGGPPLTPQQVQVLQAGLQALESAEQALACLDVAAQPDRPTPMPTLRPRAPI